MVRTSKVVATLLALFAASCGPTPLNMSSLGGSWYVWKPAQLLIEAGHQQQVLYREWKSSRVRVSEDFSSHHYYSGVDCLLWESSFGGPHIVYAGCRDRTPIVVVVMDGLEHWNMEAGGLVHVEKDRVNADGVPVRPTRIFTPAAIAAAAAQQPEFVPDAAAAVTDLAPSEVTVPVDPAAADAFGQTALHEAVRWYERDDPLPLVDALIQHGADVNAVDKYGRTALMGAAKLTHADVVRRLIQAGAYVNARDIDGTTALMEAGGALYNQVDMVQALLRAGANKTYRDKYGHTAFDMIRSNTDPQLKVLLAVE